MKTKPPKMTKEQRFAQNSPSRSIGVCRPGVWSEWSKGRRPHPGKAAKKAQKKLRVKAMKAERERTNMMLCGD